MGAYTTCRWFQKMEYEWKSLVGSNQRLSLCSLLPTPFTYTFVCTEYGSPVVFPRNSKSNSLWFGPSDDIYVKSIIAVSDSFRFLNN